MALFWGLGEWVGVEKPYESDRSFRMNIPSRGNSNSKSREAYEEEIHCSIKRVYKGKP